jgi:group II intron reverse transcriptase/maturase
MRITVQALQDKLSRAAKQTLDRRFGALYDKIYREDVLEEAWERVRANDGAPGVDRQSFEHIEEVLGVADFLAQIATELRERRYRATPVRRCWIDKPGKPEKRPLGIPIIKDRVVQAAAKLVLEPIFETNFLECSHGFRPGRSPQQAIEKIKKEITFGKKTTVIDADIVGYFNNIRQDLLMKLVERRVSDPRVLKLIRGWLEAGVLEEGSFIETDGMGTPQGGVISPLLANIYLHSFDKMFELSGIAATLVRYADDLVVLLKGNGHGVLERVRQMLGRLGLEMHPEKTRVVSAEEGFDFLGVHFRLQANHKKAARWKQICRVWPSKRSFERIKQKVRDGIGRRYGERLEDRIESLNPILRGWGNYHKAVYPDRKRLRKLDGFVRKRFQIFLKRKYSDPSRGSRRVHDNLLVRLGLYQFA